MKGEIREVTRYTKIVHCNKTSYISQPTKLR